MFHIEKGYDRSTWKLRGMSLTKSTGEKGAREESSSSDLVQRDELKLGHIMMREHLGKSKQYEQSCGSWKRASIFREQ